MIFAAYNQVHGLPLAASEVNAARIQLVLPRQASSRRHYLQALRPSFQPIM